MSPPPDLSATVRDLERGREEKEVEQEEEGNEEGGASKDIGERARDGGGLVRLG